MCFEKNDMENLQMFVKESKVVKKKYVRAD